ncbi:ankyrin repeat-containing protein ITN1-like [Spinacia oleracea]|uniref:Ankyrin repeat-containing protein ITN1-like n=1 Tax=Spinacia oleracea TaxID=3562 RepID=A0ABM3RSD1_SPIOL|nr:ankyrin repeat-containing protein ITN1-like [Spinacia oleracea]
MYILSMDENTAIKSQKNGLFLAIEKGCHKVAEKILEIIDNNGWNQLLTNHYQNILHLAPLCTTTTNHESTNQVVKLLVEAYKEEFPNWDVSDIFALPWFAKNKANEGPLHLAIQNQHEELALDLLKLHQADDINELLDYYVPEHTTLFQAIENNCPQVAEHILSRLDEDTWSKYLKDSFDGRNIMHLVPMLTNEKFGTWLVNEVPEFITQKDVNGQSAWDKAYEIGPAWFIKAVLEKDPTVFNSAPLVWTKACEKGHVSALCAFINHNPGAFRDLCIEHKDSPLHHIRLPNLTNEGSNQSSRFQRETLLSLDKIIYDIEDDGNVSAIDLLAQECDDKQSWDRMCKRIGLDPRIKTTYFQSKTNLLDVRNSLFVVAALLATITFTAGFTLPGGFNQDTGEALLAKEAAFLVFLISDTLALFFSMLVLICLIWSMVYDSSKSLVLIDKSMVLLRVALNCTLLAFMTGVYIVVAPKSLWAAIVIIVIIGALIGISVNKNLLYDVLDKLIPSPHKKPRDRIRQVELGISSDQIHLLNTRGENSNEDSQNASQRKEDLDAVV